MAEFNAEKLGKRLDELNREQLTAVERLSEELLAEMQREGPARAGDEPGDDAAATVAAKRKGPRRAQR